MHEATLTLVGVTFDSSDGQPLDAQQQRARIVPLSHLPLRTLDQARDLTLVTMTCFDNAMITEVTSPDASPRWTRLPGELCRAALVAGPRRNHWPRTDDPRFRPRLRQPHHLALGA